MEVPGEATTRDPFEAATLVTERDGRRCGRTSDDYFAFVGPFGGITAATMLRALLEHPDRLGDPLALTVNFCAPIAPGAFDLVPRLVKANRSTQHWSVELSQQGADAAAFATAVFALRPSTWSHQEAAAPATPTFEDAPIYPYVGAASWVGQFEFRFVENEPTFGASPSSDLSSAHTKVWIGNRVPRRIDALSLAAIADAFFGRIFHVRSELVPFGTVSMTTYFHADADDLAAEDTTAVLGIADAKVFHKSYADQTGELWSPGGRLLATSHQIAYFKA